MWTITALASFALVFQFGILVDCQTASVDCGNDGIGMSLNITGIPDLSLWTEQADRDTWRLNNDTDCGATFGAGNVTYGTFNATDCADLTSTPNFLQYEFLINAAPVGSSPTRMYDHSYIIRCRYNRNGTVWSSFIPRHGLGLAAFAPGIVVAYFPLNSVYGAQEIDNSTGEGILNGVELAPGPDGNDGTSYQSSGTSSSFIEFPNTDGGLSVSGSITIALWVYPGSAGDTGPLFQYYNETSVETGVSFSIASGTLSAQIAPSEMALITIEPLVEGEWSHVAVSYDGSTGKAMLFVDGAIVATVFIRAGIDLATLTAFPVFLGSIGSGGAGHFEGRIARVRLFSEALTDEQVQNVRGFLDAEALQIRDMTFNMALYDESTYAVGDLITSTVPLEDRIYVRVSINHQFGIGVDLLLYKCTATTDMAGNNNAYNLINQGSCEYESTLNYNCASQTGETEDYSFQAFRYPGQPDIADGADVWLHCTVYACLSGNAASVCQTECTRSDDCGKRKRRETGQFSDDTKYELTSGPYRFVDNEKAQTDTTEEREDHPSSNARLAVILAVSGGIVAIAVIVVIVAIIVRRKRRQQNITGTESPDIRM